MRDKFKLRTLLPEDTVAYAATDLATNDVRLGIVVGILDEMRKRLGVLNYDAFLLQVTFSTREHVEEGTW